MRPSTCVAQLASRNALAQTYQFIRVMALNQDLDTHQNSAPRAVRPKVGMNAGTNQRLPWGLERLFALGAMLTYVSSLRFGITNALRRAGARHAWRGTRCCKCDKVSTLDTERSGNVFAAHTSADPLLDRDLTRLGLAGLTLRSICIAGRRVSSRRETSTRHPP